MKKSGPKRLDSLREYITPAIIYLVYLSIIVLFPNLLVSLGLSSIQESFRNMLFFWGTFWDGFLYYKIGFNGYVFPEYAFFPGYPLLLKFFGQFIPVEYLLNINFIISLFTTLSLYKFLDLLEVDKKYKSKILILFLAFPTSFFLIANYVESIYILTSIWVLYFLVKNRLSLFLLCGFVLSFFKITAISIPLIYLTSLLKNKILIYDLSNKENLIKWFKFLGISIILVGGILIYFSLLWFKTGDFLIYFEAQKQNWNRDVLGLKLGSIFMRPDVYFVRISELLIFTATSVLLVRYRVKLRIEFYVFSLLHFVLPISTGNLLSFNRLALLCFPLWLILFKDVVKSKKHYYILLILMIIWQLLGIYALQNRQFVG